MFDHRGKNCNLPYELHVLQYFEHHCLHNNDPFYPPRVYKGPLIRINLLREKFMMRTILPHIPIIQIVTINSINNLLKLRIIPGIVCE